MPKDQATKNRSIGTPWLQQARLTLFLLTPEKWENRSWLGRYWNSERQIQKWKIANTVLGDFDLGVVDKAIWKQYKGALRDKLKYCQTDICTCIGELIEEFMTGHAGLPERFQRMLGPNATQAGIPGHATQIQERQKGLQQAMEAYDDNGCGPGGSAYADAQSYVARPIPTQADWEAVNGRPMPAGFSGPTWTEVGLFALAVGVTLLPIDGPAGDVVAWGALAKEGAKRALQ